MFQKKYVSKVDVVLMTYSLILFFNIRCDSKIQVDEIVSDESKFF